MSTRTLAIVQARMSSTRLPGKVLLPLGGRPLIGFMLERVRRAKAVDDIVLATSTDASDDALAEAVVAMGFAVYRGSLNDVLARFAGAAQGRNADVLVRLTGDCPLIDPALIDRAVNHLRDHQLDYVTNGEPAMYPDGLDVEAFTLAALQRTQAEAQLPSEREHVTPYMRSPQAQMRRGSLRGAVDLSALRWTVDHADDLTVVRELVDALGAQAALQADLFDFLRVLDARPQLLQANLHQRNEGYLKSLQQDAMVAT
ncbi:glycosyltransferase family protein [Aquabacterium sp.]|uniref:glycosyltransferase family protein n=1 Tax=Aquabacterium sp. TaxID=1872578 RepID=UPI002D1C06DC|nr:glycosyltransferase family protein [Aquabacterium sp.]HSW04740.1 glycosyltransferase family protein [Aquabacterium sp.]